MSHYICDPLPFYVKISTSKKILIYCAPSKNSDFEELGTPGQDFLDVSGRTHICTKQESYARARIVWLDGPPDGRVFANTIAGFTAFPASSFVASFAHSLVTPGWFFYSLVSSFTPSVFFILQIESTDLLMGM